MHAVSQEFAVKSHKGKRWEWVGGLFGFYQQTHTDGPVDFRQDGIDLLITKQTNNQLAALKQDPALAGMPDITIDIDNRNLYIDGIYKHRPTVLPPSDKLRSIVFLSTVYRPP